VNALSPTVGALPKKRTLRREVAPEKLNSPIDDTVAGMVIEARLTALEKARLSIVTSVLVPAKFTESSALAPINASSPMDVTVAGIITEVRLLADVNAPSSMVVTPLGTE
jgi:hypothetical protein